MAGHHADVTVHGAGDDQLRRTRPQLALDGDQMDLNLCHERLAFRSMSSR